MKRYVVVAGNIGAGKSTLVEALAERLSFRPWFEPVAENPYLADFYLDMRRWAFHSQTFFLAHRVRSHRALADDPWPVVQDRSIYEDAEVFARALYERGAMEERDWSTYRDLYRAAVELLPRPDLVVYLRASVPTLLARISRRGRDFEAGIPETYLAELNSLYERWISDFSLAPVLEIPCDRLDFVADPSGIDLIARAAASRLAGGQGSLFG